MKILLLIFTVFLLASCQSEEPTIVLSNITNVYSKDVSKVQVDETVIYVQEGLTIAELFTILASTDDSTQSYSATANDGSPKTRDKLFEYDQIVVTSESKEFSKTYSVRYFV